jgi:CspA family cold shock protein
LGHRAAALLSFQRTTKGDYMATHTGTIKWMNKDKGFGFILPKDGGADIFVHTNNCIPKGQIFKEGQKVEFEVMFDKKKGKQTATNVRAV